MTWNMVSEDLSWIWSLTNIQSQRCHCLQTKSKSLLLGSIDILKVTWWFRSIFYYWHDDFFCSQVVVGNTHGNMALIDVRNGNWKKTFSFNVSPSIMFQEFILIWREKYTNDIECFSAGKLVHIYKGFAGAIRSVHCHGSLPLVASCGLDRFLHVHNVDTKQQLHKVSWWIYSWWVFIHTERKRNFSFVICRYSMWTANSISLELMWKWRRFRVAFRSVLSLDVKCAIESII